MQTLIPWFILKNIPGIGDLTFKRLLKVFHSPQNVLSAPYDELLRIKGVTSATAKAVCGKHTVTDAIKRELDDIQAASVNIITFTDAAYPYLLQEIPDPPPFLYVKGSLERLLFPLAVVGSRKASAYGLTATRKLCADLCAKGLSIVSGLALGIDSAAHQGALESGGATFAVLGNGLQSVYPRENLKLARRIVENGGAVISELPMRMGPEAFNFPKRNRIISGLCMGTVVTEAAAKSGSLITARMALEQNREVFAVPGSIQSGQSVGCHYLLKNGAKLVESDGDIIEELGGSLAALLNKHQTELPPECKNLAQRLQNSIYPLAELERLYVGINADPKHIDTLCREFGKPAATMLGMLTELELESLVQKLPGDYYIKEDLA